MRNGCYEAQFRICLSSLTYFSLPCYVTLSLYFTIFRLHPRFSFLLSLSMLSTPDSGECRSPCLQALLFLSHLSLTILSFPNFSPLLLFHWSCDFSGCRLLDRLPGWIPLYWMLLILRMESAEATQSQGLAASIAWNGSEEFPSLCQ